MFNWFKSLLPGNQKAPAAAPLPQGPVKDGTIYAQTMTPETPESYQSRMARQAAAAAPAPPAMPLSASSAPAAPARPTAAQVDPLTAALGATSTVRDHALANAQKTFDTNMAGYQEENALDRQNYTKQTTQNETNLTSGRMASMMQAVQGGQGLRAILGSLGALSGTGSYLADNAISSAANKDIGEVDNAFKTNAESLNTAWSDTERKQRQRDADARAALENDKRSAEREFLTTRQGILTQLANLFGPNSPEAANYSKEAAGLYPQIANTAQQSVAGYQARSPLYSNQALETYKGGVRDLTVGLQPGNSSSNSPLFAFNKKREEELA